MSQPQILALDISGIPRTWVNFDDAIVYYAKNQVAWSLGEVVARYHGGIQQSTGKQSYLEAASIIAVKGDVFGLKKSGKVPLTNRSLFARDKQICCFCGDHFPNHALSRDHIIPRVHGGEDKWTNCVTACKSCNQKKGCLSLKEAKMQLLYVPYAPNTNEAMILQNRNILVDQMDYLMAGVPKHSRLFS